MTAKRKFYKPKKVLPRRPDCSHRMVFNAGPTYVGDECHCRLCGTTWIFTEKGWQIQQ